MLFVPIAADQILEWIVRANFQADTEWELLG